MAVSEERVSRGRLLKRAGVGAAALGAGSMLTASTASAACTRVDGLHRQSAVARRTRRPARVGPACTALCVLESTVEGCCFCFENSFCARSPTCTILEAVPARLELRRTRRYQPLRCRARSACRIVARATTTPSVCAERPAKATKPGGPTDDLASDHRCTRSRASSEALVLSAEVDDDVRDRHREALPRRFDDASLEPVGPCLRGASR